MDPYVENASVQFIKWSDLYATEKPFQIFIDLPAADDVRRTNVVFEEKDVLFRDIRGKESAFSLDRQGFMVRRHSKILGLETPTVSFIENVYLPSVEELLKTEIEGADRVFIFDWRVSIIVI
jgi:hypothetical protein